MHGRPPTLNLAHSDCRFPRDLDPCLSPTGELGLGCEWSLLGAYPFFNVTDSKQVHAWKFRYSAVCLSISVQLAFSVHRASYSSLLELDKRIRSFPLPAHLLSPVHETGGRDWDADPSCAMQQFFPVCERESSEYTPPSDGNWLSANVKMCRPHIHPQMLVCRGITRLAGSLPTRIWPVRGCGLSQCQYFDQRIEEPHQCAPYRSRSRLVLLV